MESDFSLGFSQTPPDLCHFEGRSSQNQVEICVRMKIPQCETPASQRERERGSNTNKTKHNEFVGCGACPVAGRWADGGGGWRWGVSCSFILRSCQALGRPAWAAERLGDPLHDGLYLSVSLLPRERVKQNEFKFADAVSRTRAGRAFAHGLQNAPAFGPPFPLLQDHAGSPRSAS